MVNPRNMVDFNPTSPTDGVKKKQQNRPRLKYQEIVPEKVWRFPPKGNMTRKSPGPFATMVSSFSEAWLVPCFKKG